ncbi:MAG TPA: S16 family serine protease [Nocardioides sp.]|nr:S16 family serine protease [Nocardioides sp.]
MHQRLIAAFVATPLVLVLGAVALAVPLPFASFSPGPTYDVLGRDSNAAHLVQVDGHSAYYDTGGQLRFTTVRETGAGDRLSLGEALGRWFDHDDAVLPYDYVHPAAASVTDEKQQGAAEMLTSQDYAKAVALRELGYKVPPVLEVMAVSPGTPAASELEAGDELLAVDGTRLSGTQAGGKLLVDTITRIGTHPLTLTIRRDHKLQQIRITPAATKDGPKIGVQPGIGYHYPFDIELHIDPNVGGPSAGLMFSLAIYDTLTPGSLTGGAIVAGTGELEPSGKVDPIGGIAQKIAASKAAGAQLFLVPSGNCVDVTKLHPSGMRLVEVTTAEQALAAVKAWAADHNADLPSCG